MGRRICSFLIATLPIMTWIFATSWPFAACKGAHEEGTGYTFHTPQPAFSESKQGHGNMEKALLHRNEEAYKGLSSLGSRPPNCQHKCGGCKPCIAIQVPTTNDHLGVQYTNYEPEGWKCKCGTSLFNP